MAYNYNQQVKKYLKKNEKNLYREYKGSLGNAVALVNQVVRHYQWIFEIQDFTYLDLQDRANKNYLNLFLYGLESSEELAHDFVNYFVFSFKNAFDMDTRKWSIDLIFNTFIHQCSYHEFDLLAMYALIGATYDRFIKFIIKLEINPKLGMSLKEIIDFFELIVNQPFYNELKTEILNKRKNSYYFKKPEIEVHFPEDRAIEPYDYQPKWKLSKRIPLSRRINLFNKQDLESLKTAQASSEAQFATWDANGNEPSNEAMNFVNHQVDGANDERIVDVPDILKETTHEEVKEQTVRFKPRPDIKMIKLNNY